MKLARMAGLLAALLTAAPPAMAATVAVAPLRDSGAKRGAIDYVRHQIEAGLNDGGLVVVGASALGAAAQKQGLSPGDLGRPAVLMPVAKAAGADAVLTGTLDAKELQIRVFNLDGVELWSRPIKLVKGHLAPDIPGKIAKAVSAAIASAAANSASNDSANASAAGNAALDAAGGTDSSSADGSDAQASGDSSSQAADTNATVGTTSSGDTTIVTPKHPDTQVAAADTSSSSSSSEGEVAIEGPPKEAKVDTTPAPPIIDFGVGFALMTRTYNVTPNDASDASPAYKTGSPGGALVLRAELFPVPHLWQINDGLTFTLGLQGEYIYGFGETDQGLDTSGRPAQSSSRITRLTADATARLYFQMLDGTGYAGLYGGALLPSFTVGENALATPATRKGFEIGARVELPLAANYVKLCAQGAFSPADNPGVEETTDFGQTGNGRGWLFRGGFEGDYKFLGYGAYVDLAHFSDTFEGAGDQTTNGAVTDETYMTYFLMVRGRY